MSNLTYNDFAVLLPLSFESELQPCGCTKLGEQNMYRQPKVPTNTLVLHPCTLNALIFNYLRHRVQP